MFYRSTLMERLPGEAAQCHKPNEYLTFLWGLQASALPALACDPAKVDL